MASIFHNSCGELSDKLPSNKYRMRFGKFIVSKIAYVKVLSTTYRELWRGPGRFLQICCL